MNEQAGAVYAQTNAADTQAAAYRRSGDGALHPLGSFGTGGRGNGMPHLPSQSSLALSGDGRWLLVTNAGSDDVSLFAVEPDGLRLADRAASGGSGPTSVAVHDDLVYVLNNGSASIDGFRVSDGTLIALEGSSRPLSAPDADGAQVSFSRDGRTLVVTERGTNSISSYAVDEHGYADGPMTIASAGATPYGFDFTARGAVGDTRSEVCWAAATRDGRFVYVTNFGDGTISSYSVATDGSLTLLEPVAASTRLGEPGIRDEALTGDGSYLYAIDADAQRVHGWSVEDDGRLQPVGAFEGVPATVAGLAAS